VDEHSKRRRVGQAAGLLGIGVAAGGILAFGLNASASPSPGTSTAQYGYGPAGYGDGSPGGPQCSGPGGHRGPNHGLPLSGTVTAVGSSSVTIKSTTGTSAYAVDASSDIDKNGEAQLADLKGGDAVRFSVATRNGKQTIDILHAGDEAKNRPAGPPPNGGPGRLRPGTTPTTPRQ